MYHYPGRPDAFGQTKSGKVKPRGQTCRQYHLVLSGNPAYCLLSHDLSSRIHQLNIQLLRLTKGKRQTNHVSSRIRLYR